MSEILEPRFRAYSNAMASQTRDLLRITKAEYRHFIDNELVESVTGEQFVVLNPTTGEEVGNFIEAGEHEVDLAVAAARAAYKSGPWGTFTGAQRAKCMLKFADLLEEKGDEIAKWDTKSMGVPIKTAREVFYPSCVESFRYYAGYADKIEGKSFPEQMDTMTSFSMSLLEFLGWKIAPALAAGNTFIFKSSEKNPFSTLAIAGLFKEAGFPNGVVNFVSGGARTGRLLASHMDIDKISFTGSGKTGRKVQEAAIKSNMKKVTLELGGKSAAIVFRDAYMETALHGCADKFLVMSGQACLAASRVFVHCSVAEDFIDGLKERFRMVPMRQDPSSPTTTFGPLVDKVQFDRVVSYIESARGDTELITGGGYGNGDCYYVQPTIFLNPAKDAKIYKEEIFGPVLTVTTFETENEAIELANDTTYGLSACIYTSSMPRALRVASKIEVGTIAINSAFWPDIRVPFGGYKQSGQGRESGKAGLEEYLQAKTIRIYMNAGSDGEDDAGDI